MTICHRYLYSLKSAYRAMVRTYDVCGHLCPCSRVVSSRMEFGAEAKRWIDGMNDLAKKLNITIHGAYSSPNEHTFYFILESDDLKSITAFFSGIMLTHNKGHISPVIPVQVASDTLLK